jgi:hypothetical protein
MDKPDDILTDEIEVEPTTEPQDDSGPIRQLRENLKRTQADLVVAQERERIRAYADLGLDPEHGIGKAAAQTYEDDPQGLADYVATQYGWTGPENPMVAEINKAYSRLDQAAEGSGSAPVTTPADTLEQARRGVTTRPPWRSRDNRSSAYWVVAETYRAPISKFTR